MTLRRRLTLWYGGLLVLCVVLAVLPSYDELVLDASQHSAAETSVKWKRFHAVLRDMVIDAFPLITIGLAGGWFFTRRALRPLESVADWASHIDEHSLGERLPEEKRDVEVAKLAQAVNEMTGRLETSFARMKEFSLHASHELKTPLAIMRGDMETSLRTWTHLTGDQRAKIASQIDEIDRLTQIVDGLAFLVKADSGVIAIVREPVSFASLVDDMVEDAEILAAPGDITVRLTHRDEATVLGDPQRLRQMMLNLADNAIKYNEPRGRLEIALRRSAKELTLTVGNSGPGIGVEEQRRVFERFYRGTNGGRVEGSGLGLSIVQWIVHAHHGHIEFRSQPGHAEVEVRLPLQTTH